MSRNGKEPAVETDGAGQAIHALNRAFTLNPERPGKPGVLLVHGFTASPHEMRPLAKSLCQAGYPVAAVRLPGHGTSPDDLAQRRYEEWLNAVLETHDSLSQRTGRVYGIGISTGALLLLALAAQRDLNGLVLLSPFLALRHRLAPLAGLLRHWKKYQRRALPAHLADFCYDRRPLNGVHQINRLIRHIRPSLPRITAPTLAINALGDRTVDIASGQRLFQRLGSPHKEYHLYGADTGHGLASPDQPHWPRMVNLVLCFLDALPGNGRARIPGDSATAAPEHACLPETRNCR
jgi:carboxylesterase